MSRAEYLSFLLESRVEAVWGETTREDETTFVAEVKGREYRVSVAPVGVSEAGVTHPSRVVAGELLHAVTGDWFGRDAPACMRVEGVGPAGDWVVVRGVSGWQVRRLFMAQGPKIAEVLTAYRERADFDGMVCCEEAV